MPQIHNRQFKDNSLIKKCQSCDIIDLCLWCPANVYLETGSMEEYVDYFCRLAHARQRMILQEVEKITKNPRN